VNDAEPIRTDAHLHPKVPLLTHLGLAHRRIARALLTQMRAKGMLMQDDLSSLNPETLGAIELLLGTASKRHPG
jgi:hypothetical protein